MIDKVSVNADRIRKYEFDHGRLEVERFLDAVLAIEEHIDPNVHIKRAEPGREAGGRPERAPETAYDDLWRLEGRASAADAADGGGEADEPPLVVARRRVSEAPEKDLLLFLAEHAPGLADWQRDILLIVREEMLYFVPQMQTKICNEGWAAFVHSRILREMDLTDGEYTEFAQLHSSVLSPSRMHINPYHLGYRMLEDIERRWDNPTEEQRARGMQPGQGRKKLFEVREEENDISFLRNYLTKELVEDLDLYIYRKIGDEWIIVEKNWEKVRDGIVASMTNFGQPYLTVNDGDFNHNSELLLAHHYEGYEMDLPYAEKTLEYVYAIWGRPVHLETTSEEKRIRLSYNGAEQARHLVDRSEHGTRGGRGERG
jgi:stage V sporulation protein R